MDRYNRRVLATVIGRGGGRKEHRRRSSTRSSSSSGRVTAAGHSQWLGACVWKIPGLPWDNLNEFNAEECSVSVCVRVWQWVSYKVSVPVHHTAFGRGSGRAYKSGIHINVDEENGRLFVCQWHFEVNDYYYHYYYHHPEMHKCAKHSNQWEYREERQMIKWVSELVRARGGGRGGGI